MMEHFRIGRDTLPDNEGHCDLCNFTCSAEDPVLWFFPHPGYELVLARRAMGYVGTQRLAVEKGHIGVCERCYPFVRMRDFQGLWAWVTHQNPSWAQGRNNAETIRAYQESVLKRIEGNGDRWQLGQPRPCAA